MSGPYFFQTNMGRKFYEKQLPDLIESINRMAIAQEKQNELVEKSLESNEELKKMINQIHERATMLNESIVELVDQKLETNKMQITNDVLGIIRDVCK